MLGLVILGFGLVVILPIIAALRAVTYINEISARSHNLVMQGSVQSCCEVSCHQAKQFIRVALMGTKRFSGNAFRKPRKKGLRFLI